MSQDLSGKPEAPRVPRPEDDYPTPDRHKNAVGKALCGACGYKTAVKEWRCTNQDMPFYCPAVQDSCPNFLKKPFAPRPPQPKEKSLPVPEGVKFLYFGRPKQGSHAHIGVVTIAYRINQVARQIEIGFSCCSPQDSWVKAKGRDIAMTRLATIPINVPYIYHTRQLIVDAAQALMTHDFQTLAQIGRAFPSSQVRRHIPSWTRGLAKWLPLITASDRLGRKMKAIIKAAPGSPIDWARSRKPHPTGAQILSVMMRDIAALGND